MSREAVEAAAATVGSKVIYTGAGATVASWLLSSEFGVLAGLLLGVVGLLVNIYFKRQENQEEHLARMRKLARDSDRAPLDFRKADE
ncbi:hypothetical protein H6CHR_03650 [Variovorax sp. PBL-H6]|uniref:holin n=1 Tax=Variovorax sp. PBL-H6 TaxID=434009 RepID=UPI0013174C96|nr:holin [Variovorax sp. PBL-H6]VTU31687.1 hypothetical protein H6CHR_03650 [Variovorax sp. PBL-H6]